MIPGECRCVAEGGLPHRRRVEARAGRDGQGPQAVAACLEQEGAAGAGKRQGPPFPSAPEEGEIAVRERRPRYGKGGDPSAGGDEAPSGATTLDRVHTAMLLQAGGRTTALHALVRADRERGLDFLRLSNALSALYPRGSEEKRLLDAMLLAAPK